MLMSHISQVHCTLSCVFVQIQVPASWNRYLVIRPPLIRVVEVETPYPDTAFTQGSRGMFWKQSSANIRYNESKRISFRYNLSLLCTFFIMFLKQNIY